MQRMGDCWNIEERGSTLQEAGIILELILVAVLVICLVKNIIELYFSIFNFDNNPVFTAFKALCILSSHKNSLELKIWPKTSTLF